MYVASAVEFSISHVADVGQDIPQCKLYLYSNWVSKVCRLWSIKYT